MKLYNFSDVQKKKRKTDVDEMRDEDSKPKQVPIPCLLSNSQKKSKKIADSSDDVLSSPTEDDAPMPDITTLLLPDLTTTVPVEVDSIHPSRIKNFNNTTTFAEVDPSFLPRPKDIARARRALDRKLNPPPPKPKKLTLQERQQKRKEKKERKENPPPVIYLDRPVEITREPIDDPLAHLLQGLTADGQPLGELVKRCQADVKAGGGKLKVNRHLLGRLGLRREGVNEDGSGGRIVVEVLERGWKMPGGGDVSSDEDDDSD